MEPRFDGVVEIYSDTTESNVAFSLPPLMDSRCDNSYNFGLWCKNYAMMKRWKEDPAYANVRWFFRMMDDTWLHLENLVWLTSQYDHRQPLVLGERVCAETGYDYPGGGTGFAISRGVIDTLGVLDIWNRTLEWNRPSPILDDVMWGIFIAKLPITFIHTPSMYGTLVPSSDLFKLYLSQKNHPWALNFRPVASHQAGNTSLRLMPEIHEKLNGLDYNFVDPFPYVPPHCKCDRKVHLRCTWNSELQGRGKPCNWSAGPLVCLGPPPYPHWNGTK